MVVRSPNLSFSPCGRRWPRSGRRWGHTGRCADCFREGLTDRPPDPSSVAYGDIVETGVWQIVGNTHSQTNDLVWLRLHPAGGEGKSTQTLPSPAACLLRSG